MSGADLFYWRVPKGECEMDYTQARSIQLSMLELRIPKLKGVKV